MTKKEILIDLIQSARTNEIESATIYYDVSGGKTISVTLLDWSIKGRYKELEITKAEWEEYKELIVELWEDLKGKKKQSNVQPNLNSN